MGSSTEHLKILLVEIDKSSSIRRVAKKYGAIYRSGRSVPKDRRTSHFDKMPLSLAVPSRSQAIMNGHRSGKYDIQANAWWSVWIYSLSSTCNSRISYLHCAGYRFADLRSIHRENLT